MFNTTLLTNMKRKQEITFIIIMCLSPAIFPSDMVDTTTVLTAGILLHHRKCEPTAHRSVIQFRWHSLTNIYFRSLCLVRSHELHHRCLMCIAKTFDGMTLFWGLTPTNTHNHTHTQYTANTHQHTIRPGAHPRKSTEDTKFTVMFLHVEKLNFSN